MVSSLTKEGADATLKALDLGAVDFMTKDSQSFGGADIIATLSSMSKWCLNIWSMRCKCP